jgi:hypothetical protein
MNRINFSKLHHRVRILTILLVSIISIPVTLVSCASSKSSTVVANGLDLSKYKYVVFGDDDDKGDAELSDILMLVQNAISQKLQVVSSKQALALIHQGEGVLSPRINVKTEKWDGGHTFITINFFDFNTNQSVVILKSSGIGLSISQDQKLAYKAIMKELNKTFK